MKTNELIIELILKFSKKARSLYQPLKAMVHVDLTVKTQV